MLTQISIGVVFVMLVIVLCIDYFDTNDRCITKTIKALVLVLVVVFIIMGLYLILGWITAIEAAAIAAAVIG